MSVFISHFIAVLQGTLDFQRKLQKVSRKVMKKILEDIA